MTTILPTSLQRIILLYIDGIEELLCSIKEPYDIVTITIIDALNWLDNTINIPERFYFQKFYDEVVILGSTIGEWLINKYNMDKSECRKMYCGYIKKGNVFGLDMIRAKFDLSREECLGDDLYYYKLAIHYGLCNIAIWFCKTFKLTKQEALGENGRIYKKAHSSGDWQQTCNYLSSTFKVTEKEIWHFIS